MCIHACYQSANLRNLASFVRFASCFQIRSLQYSRLHFCILTWPSNPPPLPHLASDLSVAPAKVPAAKISRRRAERTETTPRIDLQGLLESSKRTGFQGARRATSPRKSQAALIATPQTRMQRSRAGRGVPTAANARRPAGSGANCCAARRRASAEPRAGEGAARPLALIFGRTGAAAEAAPRCVGHGLLLPP